MRSPFQCHKEFAPLSAWFTCTSKDSRLFAWHTFHISETSQRQPSVQTSTTACRADWERASCSAAWGTCPACSNVTRRCAVHMQHPHASPIRGSCRGGTTSCPTAPPQSCCLGRGSGTGWERTARAFPWFWWSPLSSACTCTSWPLLSLLSPARWSLPIGIPACCSLVRGS